MLPLSILRAGRAKMASIDTEMIGLAVLLLTPIYLYLHKLSLAVTRFADKVSNCQYCNKGKIQRDPVEIEPI